MERLSCRIGSWVARFMTVSGPTRVVVDPDSKTIMATPDATFDLFRQAVDEAEAAEFRAALSPPTRIASVA